MWTTWADIRIWRCKVSPVSFKFNLPSNLKRNRRYYQLWNFNIRCTCEEEPQHRLLAGFCLCMPMRGVAECLLLICFHNWRQGFIWIHPKGQLFWTFPWNGGYVFLSLRIRNWMPPKAMCCFSALNQLPILVIIPPDVASHVHGNQVHSEKKKATQWP